MPALAVHVISKLCKSVEESHGIVCRRPPGNSKSKRLTVTWADLQLPVYVVCSHGWMHANHVQHLKSPTFCMRLVCSCLQKGTPVMSFGARILKAKPFSMLYVLGVKAVKGCDKALPTTCSSSWQSKQPSFS